ncbi:PadR family transcriptional regulator [Bacilliculturomica massiliensis]|uniref:PadR family transcriptional regulator n=1 Tax=Bacilliculturomica massiliensis TaxID=1917867 RepID=UPI00102F4E1C|nr:helix-turn-helix transcriptional regulator [Bacilliculturomica massiliensis]
MQLDKGLIGGSTVLMVLSLLKEKDCYGYEIIRLLEQRSDSTFEFKEGSLYPVLHRMENSGYVTSYMHTADSGKQRRYYRITGKGQEQLAEERRQWDIFSRSVNKVIRGEACGLV